MSTFTLDIVTPTKIIESENISYVRCPGKDGLFGILSGHRESIIALDYGEIKVTQNGNDSFYATSGGFAEVTNEKVQLLVETAEKSSDIDKDRAEASLNRAKDRLKSHDEIDHKRAEAALVRALNRLTISKR